LLVGSMVIDVELDMRIIVRSFATAIGMRLKPLNIRTDPESD
jgi:hypothetical protein